MQDKGGFVPQPYCSEIMLFGGDSTSHGYGRVCDLKDLFLKTIGREFPVINENHVHGETDDIGLIEPADMITYCDNMLASEEVDELDLRERIEWFKELSEQGYYLAYNWE